MKATITHIGSQAIDPKEPMLILFDETATPALREYSVVQHFAEPDEITLTPGMTLRFDDQAYQVAAVGRMANQNLNELGHVTLIFGDEGAENIANGVYLTPHVLPELHVESQIYYS